MDVKVRKKMKKKKMYPISVLRQRRGERQKAKTTRKKAARKK